MDDHLNMLRGAIQSYGGSVVVKSGACCFSFYCLGGRPLTDAECVRATPLCVGVDPRGFGALIAQHACPF